VVIESWNHNTLQKENDFVTIETFFVIYFIHKHETSNPGLVTFKKVLSCYTALLNIASPDLQFNFPLRNDTNPIELYMNIYAEA
jgi:hypothetical protein